MSWISYPEDHPFSLHNIPYGVFTTAECETPHCCTIVGDFVVDLSALGKAKLFNCASINDAFTKSNLLTFVRLGLASWVSARHTLLDLFAEETPTLKENNELRATVLIPVALAIMQLPMPVHSYMRFHGSQEHNTLFSSLEPLLAMEGSIDNLPAPMNAFFPNHPMGYFAWAPSVKISGSPITRPHGVLHPTPLLHMAEKYPMTNSIFGPSQKMDVGVEAAAWVGCTTDPGSPLLASNANHAVFGYSMLLHWTARDTLANPAVGALGVGSAGSTVSPWIVTHLATEAFLEYSPSQHCSELAPYLKHTHPDSVPIHINWYIRNSDGDSSPSYNLHSTHPYWSWSQLLAQRTVTGQALEVGDLVASGTFSGTDNFGSLSEATQKRKGVKITKSSERLALLDGDEVHVLAYCIGDGKTRLGFGDCWGSLQKALTLFPDLLADHQSQGSTTVGSELNGKTRHRG